MRKSSVLAQCNPFTDISNMSKISSNSKTQRSKQSGVKYLENKNTKLSNKSCIQNLNNVVNLKFRLKLNLFSEDHYIIKISVSPTVKLKEIEKYLQQAKSLNQLKNKLLLRLQSFGKDFQSSKKSMPYEMNFYFQEVILDKDSSIQQIREVIQKSETSVQFIDFNFDWKKPQNSSQNQNQRVMLASQQSCCQIM